MPPQSEEDDGRHRSTLGFKYPHNRDVALKTSDRWIEGKRADDGAEGLWRVHDNLYDLTDFVKKHPGGQFWLDITKGTDITEAFECHHISTAPEQLLKKFEVRKAKTTRNSPFTFEENGFYRTLKRNIRPVLKTLPKTPVIISAVMTDMFLAITFVLSILACKYWSFSCGIVAGFFLTCTTIAGHNYFHKRDNFRMHYFDFSLMQTREWRVSHALSHHLYTNTIIDLEISMFEPLIEYFPKEKSLLVRFISWIYAPLFIWLPLYYFSFVKRIVQYTSLGQTDHLCLTDLVPFSLPLVMYIFAGQSLLASVSMWLFIIGFGSFWFGLVGLNAAHHHPDIFHDGDTPRPGGKMDWGIGQLDAVMDRNEITGSHFLVLTNFGDHALHHFFPTLDHGQLIYLYPVLKETMKQFNVDLRMTSQLEMIKGQFKQLARIKPNPNPPNLFKKNK